MHELDLFPETKPVQAAFEPVMIGGHSEKQDGESDKRPVAGLIPFHFVESDCADGSDHEDDETPAGESGTGGCRQGNHTVEPRHQAGQCMGFGPWRHRLVVGHSADLTGWGCPRQSPGGVMAEEWIDVTVRSDVDAAELLGLLADPFVQGSWQDEGTIHIYWPRQHWSPEQGLRLRQVLQHMEGGERPRSDIQVQSLPHQDWNRQWAQSVRPIRIGKRVVIRPSWEPVDLQPGDIEIILDPKQAFGTGHHATTRMLLEWLEDRIHGGEFVLDVGAGSGILAMAALRLRAGSALGVECDPVAVDCARDYAAENGFGGNLEFLCGTLEEVDRQGALRPDLVLANLDRRTLLLLRDALAQYVSHGSRLLLSGILIEQEREIVEGFSKAGAMLLQRREQEGWVALEMLMGEFCEGVN